MPVATRFFPLILAALLCGCGENRELSKTSPTSSSTVSKVRPSKTSPTPSSTVSKVQPSVAEDSSRIAFEEALRVWQKAPEKINELRVSVDNQDLSLLSAALILEEDTTVIKSLLDQGADIKMADAEGNGIVQAIVANTRWRDQEKEELIEIFYDKVDSPDAIDANRWMGMHQRHMKIEERRRVTPWGKEIRSKNPRIAHLIIEKMSFNQVNNHGLYLAVVNKEGNDIIRMLLDKSRKPMRPEVTNRLDQVFARSAAAIGKEYFESADLTNIIGEYVATERHFHVQHGMYPNLIAGHPLWSHAWARDSDVEVAISIIREFIPHVYPPIDHAEMAATANETVATIRRESLDHAPEEIDAAWSRIKDALMAIGVNAALLDD
jgi:hypothetical protein